MSEIALKPFWSPTLKWKKRVITCENHQSSKLTLSLDLHCPSPWLVRESVKCKSFTLKLETVAVISNELKQNEDLQLSCLENLECTDWIPSSIKEAHKNMSKMCLLRQKLQKLPCYKTWDSVCRWWWTYLDQIEDSLHCIQQFLQPYLTLLLNFSRFYYEII